MQIALSPEARKKFRRVLWGKEGFEPHAKQELALDSNARKVVMACGKKAGKTTTLIRKVIEESLSPNRLSGLRTVKITCCSISYDQSRLVFDPVVFALKNDFGIKVGTDHSKTDPGKIVFTNPFGYEVEIKCSSTKNPETLPGFKFDFAAIDEAALMDENIWTKYLAYNIRRCLIATSPVGKNWVYRFYLMGRDNNHEDEGEFFSMNFDTFTNTRMPGEDYQALLQEAEWCKKYAPYTYKQDFLGEFIDGGDSFFQGYDALIQKGVKPQSNGVIMPAIPGSFYVAGLDLARYRDHTVLTILRADRTQVFWFKWGHLPWSVQKLEIISCLRKYPKCSIYLDSTNMGDPIADDLTNEGFHIIPIDFTPKRRSELLTETRLVFSHPNGACLADIPDQTRALSDVVVLRSDSGRDIVGDASGHLPDEVAALSLALHGLRGFPYGAGVYAMRKSAIIPEIDKLGRPIYDGSRAKNLHYSVTNEDFKRFVNSDGTTEPRGVPRPEEIGSDGRK